MTDIVFYDGNSPVPVNGKMIPHASNIQIELEIGNGSRESISIRYSNILEISKTGEKSRIQFSGNNKNSADRLIVFSDKKIHDLIYNYWTSDKHNPVVRLLSIFTSLPNSKKIAISLVLLPVVIFVILLLLNKSYVFVPVSIDKYIGSMAVNNILSGKTVVKDNTAQIAIEKLTKKIIPPKSDYNYKMLIIKKPVVNAFALPDGHIVIFSGLINQTRSPEELAGVIAHEVSHIESRHGIRQLIRVLGMSYLISSVVGAGIEGFEAPETISEIANILVYYKYSREFEREADLSSVKLLRSAGIKPDGIIRFFETMDRSKNMPEFLSWVNSHPDFNSRVKYLKKELEGIDPLHNKYHAALSAKEWQAMKISVIAFK
jgi:beta-barrel assembly-enhancing protease